MQDSKASRDSLRTMLFAVIPLSVLLAGMPAAVGAETVVPLAPFKSVALRGGGKVTLRHGSSQRVTLLKGSTDYTRATIEDDERLVIDRCRGGCPKGYELVVEIVAPEIADIMVEDGGTIQSLGNFPRQAELAVDVHDGGTIDLRSMTVDIVSARVESGGRIFTKPHKALVASVAHGGIITYWGNPQEVKRSVRQGGVVARGIAAEADKPLGEFGHEVADLPPVPPVPPVPPARRRTI